MKRGKDDDKIMGPMFPRLHVNDTDKGGPRAPPRNKMALYEQLSIPSQRFIHPALPIKPNNTNNTVSNLVPTSNQGVANERGMFFAYQLPTRPQTEKQYSQYSHLSTPTQVEQRKKLDEDDFTVPIFVQSVQNQEFGKYTNDQNREKLLHRPSKFQNPKNTGTLENNTRQEGLRTPTDSANCADRLETRNSEEPAVLGENIPPEDQNIPSHDVGNGTGFHEDRSSRSLQRGDSVSETSVVDSISGLDVTPDDIVGIIGQKHFWKARRAIVNQQRVFAVQVFELHRLIKVQRLIAASPHLLLEESAYLGKPMKALPAKKIPLNYPVKPIPSISEQKVEPEKLSHKKESLTENTVGKGSFTSIQNGVVHRASCRPISGNSPAPSINSSHNNAGPWCFSQPPGPPGHHQWLIPVMSPSEGLVYKPCLGPGFMGLACRGCGPPVSNLVMGNFVTPAYGVPAPQPPYQIPSLPTPCPHGYSSPYGMPVMNAAALSGSSVEQRDGPAMSRQVSAGPKDNASMPHQHVSAHNNRASPAGVGNLHEPHMPEDSEVQASTASSPVERQQDNTPRNCVEGRNVLPLFPTSPPIDPNNPSPQPPEAEPEPELEPVHPTRVIRVVPHNARSATESAARIFQSIQEERRQFDSL